MYVVTFYSYKGGVGRTLALMNTAARLAEHGKSVFVLDFDLEAPGIDSFEVAENKERRPGVVEYINSYLETNVVPDIREYVFSAGVSSKNSILVMPAGRKDRNYQSCLSKLDWKLIYQQKQGFLLVENLKASIAQEFSPDYVLIDSRTGLTDVSGICTLQLPNLVVLLFNLNNQNIDGAGRIHRSIKDNKLNREIETLRVATPIPDVPDYVGIRQQRLQVAEDVFEEPVDLVLPFDPFVAFQEVVLAPGAGGTYLSRSYDALTQQIMSKNKADIFTQLQEARRLRNEGNFELAEFRYEELLDTRPNNAEVWLDFGLLQKMRGALEVAAHSFAKVLELSPADVRALNQLTTTELMLGHVEVAKEYLNHLLTVCVDEDLLIALAEAFDNRGVLDASLSIYGRLNEIRETGQMQIRLGETYMRLGDPEAALEHYSRAAELEPSDLVAVYNAAYVSQLIGRGNTLPLFRKAIEIFTKRDSSTDTPPTSANIFQAISHAYAACGEYEKARHSLSEAIRIAGSLKRTPIFSSVQYRLIPPDAFLAESRALKEAMPKTQSGATTGD